MIKGVKQHIDNYSKVYKDLDGNQLNIGEPLNGF